MKKSSRKKIKLIFWLFFVIGCLWVGFVSPRHAPMPASITIKVKPALEPPPESSPQTTPLPLPSGGEELAPQPLLPAPQSGITVPVMPQAARNPDRTEAPKGAPKIAILIDDVGVDLKGSERAIALPAPISLSFLPYAVRLREQAKQAHEAGHELLLHMPMEPLGHEDPGPGALFVDLPMPELQRRFEAALASFTGFDGVNNHMGSKFTTYDEGMAMVVDELKSRHLFFLDSRTSAKSIGEATAIQHGLPTIGRDVFLDDVQTPESIRAQLDATEAVARRKGYAIAIGHPHAATLDVLEKWIEDAQRHGFVLVPVNALVKPSAAAQ